MEIRKKGEYKLTKDFVARNSVTGTTLKAGTIFEVTRVDVMGHKIIGPALLDWTYWDIPAEEVEVKNGS